MMTIDDLSRTELDELLTNTLQPSGDAHVRRQEFRDRYLIQTERFEPLIKGRARDIYQTHDIYTEVSRWALPIFNPQKRAANRLAVAYDARPTRRIHGVNEEQNDKWNHLYQEVGFDHLARSWDVWSLAMNTIYVLPIPKKDDLGTVTFDFELITGAEAEVFEDPDLPWWGPPGVLAYKLPRKRRSDGSYDPADPAMRTVDSEFFVEWNERREAVRVVRHGLGIFPAAPMRSTVPTAEDHWDYFHARGMKHTVLEVGVIAASMGWTRKTQCRFLITVLQGAEMGAVDGDEGQVMGDPESMYKLRGQGVQIGVHDLDKGVRNFMEQIRELQNEAFEQLTGAPSQIFDTDPSNPIEGRAAVVQQAAIEKHRRDKLVARERFERRMSVLMAKLAQRIRHPLAVDPKAVQESFRATFPPLPFLDTAKERAEVWVALTKFGVMTPADALVEMFGISQAEAKKVLEEKAEVMAWLNEFRASRNLPADPTREPDPALPGEGLAEEQGRAGGHASGEVRAAAASA